MGKTIFKVMNINYLETLSTWK